ncbi:ABC transporter permease [Paenibacillus sp. MY03]|uniref:carbohydrate ABC transporter permease n=1 Tax=Paenibacillus sp. MY03 TaxID=302980 RepID=UPI000B3CD41F|nr:carbohydrate ABC transporter permease [Paenibacillus sp. MY03]OUS69003.1 ABC transporter permease [Paenibacillus sp. MY03]
MRIRVTSWLWRMVLFVWALTVLLPLFWILYQSLKTNQEFFADIWAFPSHLKWGNYEKAWTQLGIGKSVINTLYYVGLSLLISLFVSTVNAYAFTRIQWKLRSLLWSVIMISLFLPGINILVSQYTLMRALDLTNSLNGLVLLAGLPVGAFELLLLGSFMRSLPKELDESAFIDGATLFQVFCKIILPLSMPGIVTIGIFKFVGLYNDFLGPFILISDPDKYPISVNMYNANAMMEFKADWVTLLAGLVITIIPTVIVYVLFQRRIIEGATMGGVKG